MHILALYIAFYYGPVSLNIAFDSHTVHICKYQWLLFSPQMFPNYGCFFWQYIENLDKLKKLQQLNLSNNMIEKMERLDKCLKLRELNLSYNLLTKIEGLENLMYLQVLNLTGNKIQHIPVWLAKRLRALRTLHLGKNNLQSVSLLCLLSSQDKVNIYL